MKLLLIIMTVSIMTLSACGILAKSMENATDTLFKVIVPDSCEIQLIEKLLYSVKTA
jgi:hypothetical protein